MVGRRVQHWRSMQMWGQMLRVHKHLREVRACQPLLLLLWVRLQARMCLPLLLVLLVLLPLLGWVLLVVESAAVAAAGDARGAAPAAAAAAVRLCPLLPTLELMLLLRQVLLVRGVRQVGDRWRSCWVPAPRCRKAPVQERLHTQCRGAVHTLVRGKLPCEH